MGPNMMVHGRESHAGATGDHQCVVWSFLLMSFIMNLSYCPGTESYNITHYSANLYQKRVDRLGRYLRVQEHNCPPLRLVGSG